MIFLSLPAYDYDSSNAVWGVHYATVSTGCRALTVNRTGYLTSEDKIRVEKADDDILPAGNYLKDCDPAENYPICVQFENWPFPKTIPPAWDIVPDGRLGGSITSDAVRRRDNRCLMSGEDYSLTMVHVVPVAQRPWLHWNLDSLRLRGLPVEDDPANLISLTSGAHAPQFDEAVWVPVPKLGQYLVHFLREEPTLAERYHNVLFEGSSGRLLLARFAWATFKNARKGRLLEFNLFHPQKDDGLVLPTGWKGVKKKDQRGGAKGKKRERSPDEDSDYVPPDENNNEITISDESLRDPSDPFLVDWLLEKAQLERRKEEYFKANPQIWQHSDKVLPSDYCSEAMDSD